MFTGFPREMVAFFAALRFNNNHAFFEEHRELYERAVKAPLTALSHALAPAVLAIDPLLDIRPGRALSRIHRDVRFRRDKSPFRDYMWIGYRRTGESREETCGFYFDVSADSAHWGCGYYHMQQPVMRRLRETILARPGRVLTIVEAPAFQARFSLLGETYARQHQPPEGLEKGLHDLYRKKNVYAEHSLEDMDKLFTPQIAEEIAADFRALQPFYELLRECMVPRAEEMQP